MRVFCFLGQSSGEQNDSTKRASLGGNGSLCFIETAPDFDGDKANQQGEKNTQHR